MRCVDEVIATYMKRSGMIGRLQAAILILGMMALPNASHAQIAILEERPPVEVEPPSFSSTAGRGSPRYEAEKGEHNRRLRDAEELRREELRNWADRRESDRRAQEEANAAARRAQSEYDRTMAEQRERTALRNSQAVDDMLRDNARSEADRRAIESATDEWVKRYCGALACSAR